MKKNFDIDFTAEQAPYFQVEDERKLCVPFTLLEQNPLMTKVLVSALFSWSTRIDVSFLHSYIPDEHSTARTFHKVALHNTIDIRNWKMHECSKEGFGDILRYVTIEGITSDEVYGYSLSLLKGKKDLTNGFYTDDYFMQINRDEMILISSRADLLLPIKNLLRKLV